MAYAFESINESYAEERVFQHKANAWFLMVLGPIVLLCWLIVSTTDDYENCRLSCYPNKVLECNGEEAVCSIETKTIKLGEKCEANSCY